MHQRKPVTSGDQPASRLRGLLKLYVAGNLATSTRAINNLQTILDKSFKGKFRLEVIDIYQQPSLASADNVTAVPMLVRQLPVPKRIMVGDMSNTERVMLSLSS